MNNPMTPALIAFKREWIESLYNARMTVTVQEITYNPDSYYDEPVETVLLEDEPCRIVEQGIDPTDGLPRTTDNYISLMCAPEHDIPPGAKIHIHNYTHELDFFKAGEAKRYSDHQTIELEFMEKGKGQYA